MAACIPAIEPTGEVTNVDRQIVEVLAQPQAIGTEIRRVVIERLLKTGAAQRLPASAHARIAVRPVDERGTVRMVVNARIDPGPIVVGAHFTARARAVARIADA